LFNYLIFLPSSFLHDEVSNIKVSKYQPNFRIHYFALTTYTRWRQPTDYLPALWNGRRFWLYFSDVCERV